MSSPNRIGGHNDYGSDKVPARALPHMEGKMPKAKPDNIDVVDRLADLRDKAALIAAAASGDCDNPNARHGIEALAYELQDALQGLAEELQR